SITVLKLGTPARDMFCRLVRGERFFIIGPENNLILIGGEMRVRRLWDMRLGRLPNRDMHGALLL
ncbi:hypothetical protein VWP32_23630, partial [Xanthomonas citri pv. citri]